MSSQEVEAALRESGYDVDEWPIGHHLDVVATAPRVPDLDVALCTLRYPEASPFLLAVLAAAAAGTELSDAEATLLFRGLFIIGGARDEQAFEPLLRLLERSCDDLDPLLGDLTTESLPKIVAGTFDGNIETLFEAIADRHRDEYVRSALMDAATFLAWDGRIEIGQYRAFLERFHAERFAGDLEFGWVSWVQAISLLGMRDLAPLVRRALDEGVLPERVLERRHFEADLGAALRRPTDVKRFHDANLGYVDDVLAELDWVRACEHLAEEEQGDEGEEGGDWDGAMESPIEPVTNPWRRVGRNDACPCGSGRKAKKCCLAPGGAS